ncbi:hypothetical protein LPJ66_000344 [Kickxella alabastrina]|uniref:Uncharacterized protein n=1 Tax=Kickxella alabastrina TaxID=61397 RepID=A0ACC1IW97_9FUNG|nr:hypothetical protein LPJ66_000344 [Kickxella alabastrina]
MRLSTEALTSLVDKPLGEMTAIAIRGKEITHIDGLSSCVQLRKLDLSDNKIDSSDALSGLRQAESLIHINLSANLLEEMDVVKYTPKANVLNMSNNRLTRICKSVAACGELRAIILGHNKIAKIEHISKLTNLNTLVISHNEIGKIPDMPLLKELTKISAAHNKIADIPVLTIYPKLKEVRLNDNKIKSIPESIRTCDSLRVIDLGNNKLDEWTSIAPLSSLPRLYNLNLKGNPICNEDRYRERVIEMIPSLRVLDGERFDQWFLDHKEKRKLRVAAAANKGQSDEEGSEAEDSIEEVRVNKKPRVNREEQPRAYREEHPRAYREEQPRAYREERPSRTWNSGGDGRNDSRDSEFGGRGRGRGRGGSRGQGSDRGRGGSSSRGRGDSRGRGRGRGVGGDR